MRRRVSDLLSLGLLQRLLALALIFASELIVISILLDSAPLTNKDSLIRLIGVWGPWALRCIVGFAALFVTFAYLKSRVALGQISKHITLVSIRWGLLAGHLCAMVVFGNVSSVLYGGGPTAFQPYLIVITWLAAGVSAIVFAGLALVPRLVWVQLLRSTGYLWAYALIAVIVACLVGNIGRSLWQPTIYLTFDLVRALLRLFVPYVIADPKTMVIGTQTFSVTLAPECSGFEGAGLILAFGSIWICLFRRECRFPRVLLLIPAGVILIFLLNAVRIALLILIGNAGAPQTALGGFHSQAGWIAFNGVALGFSIAARRVSWLTVKPPGCKTLDHASSDNPTAAYIMPLLTILGIGMISSAATSDLEWLYPLRFFAAAGMLWFFRRRYAALGWTFSWRAPAIGALVFVIWIALDHFAYVQSDRPIPAALAAVPPIVRFTWIAFRTLAPVLTVPIAEELAFRGFLMRRLISPDFESVSLQNITWLALLGSSLAFGLLHGERWLAGTIAGVLYGLALVRRGKIGEPVVAHATTNALLAAYVLAFQKWGLW